MFVNKYTLKNLFAFAYVCYLAAYIKKEKEILSRASPIPFITLCLIFVESSIVSVPALDYVPVDYVPKLFEIIGSHVFVVDVVGVLPDVESQQRVEA